MQRCRVRREESRRDEFALFVPAERGELVVDRVVDQCLKVGDAHLGVVADEGAPQGVDARGTRRKEKRLLDICKFSISSRPS